MRRIKVAFYTTQHLHFFKSDTKYDKKSHIFNKIRVKCGKYNVEHFGYYISTVQNRSRFHFRSCNTKTFLNPTQNILRNVNYSTKSA